MSGAVGRYRSAVLDCGNLRSLGSSLFRSRRHTWAVEKAKVRFGDRVLILGCGSGLGVSRCLGLGASKVVGVESSFLKLAVAYRRNRSAYFLDRLDFWGEGLEALKSHDGVFERVLLLTAPNGFNRSADLLRQILHLVEPGGLIAVTTDWLPSGAAATHAGEALRLEMIAAGGRRTQVDYLTLRGQVCSCIVGEQPSKGCFLRTAA